MLELRLKTSSISTNAKENCHRMKMSLVVSRSAMKTKLNLLYINLLSYQLFKNCLSSFWNMSISHPYNFLSNKSLLFLYVVDNTTKLPLCWNNYFPYLSSHFLLHFLILPAMKLNWMTLQLSQSLSHWLSNHILVYQAIYNNDYICFT